MCLRPLTKSVLLVALRSCWVRNEYRETADIISSSGRIFGKKAVVRPFLLRDATRLESIIVAMLRDNGYHEGLLGLVVFLELPTNRLADE